MKKSILAVLLAVVLVFSVSTAFAADTFDPSALICVTQNDGFSNTGSLNGDGYYTLTEDNTVLFELDSYGYSALDYCCTPDNGGSWEEFLTHENDFYTSAAYIIKIKSGEAAVGITPSNIAFDSTGQTWQICINGYEDAPILLINNEGKAVLAEAYYSIDRYFVEVPANFDGYLYVPYERLTYDLSEENCDVEASMMSLYQNEGFRFFWTIGMCVENLEDKEATLEMQDVYLAPTALDLEYSEEGFAPSQTENNGEENNDATDVPTEPADNGNTDNGNSALIWIIIAAAAVVVVAVVVIVVIAAKKKK